MARSFQIPQLYGDLTVLDNMLVANACHDQRLSFWQPARRRDRRSPAPTRCWSASGSSEHRERRVAELPGGVRKLLDIAMALTGQPKLLLLDEPTSGVSAEEKFPMMDTIMAALGQEQGTTVLFVEHDMDIVERHAGRVVAFYAGRIIADGAPAHGAGHRRRAPLRHRRAAAGVSAAMLKIEAVHVAIQSVVALRGLSLTVADGTMVGLVGRNGAGKTTLLRSVMGHLTPSQGTHQLRRPGPGHAAAPRARRAGHRLHARGPRPGARADGGGEHPGAGVGQQDR